MILKYFLVDLESVHFRKEVKILEGDNLQNHIHKSINYSIHNWYSQLKFTIDIHIDWGPCIAINNIVLMIFFGDNLQTQIVYEESLQVLMQDFNITVNIMVINSRGMKLTIYYLNLKNDQIWAQRSGWTNFLCKKEIFWQKFMAVTTIKMLKKLGCYCNRLDEQPFGISWIKIKNNQLINCFKLTNWLTDCLTCQAFIACLYFSNSWHQSE